MGRFGHSGQWRWLIASVQPDTINAAMSNARRLLYMATVWPEASSSAAGVRSAGMLEALTQAGWDVTVSSACAPNAFMRQLQVCLAEKLQLPHVVVCQSVQFSFKSTFPGCNWHNSSAYSLK